MTKAEISKLARILASQLLMQNIRIKHTQALDLIYAAYGLSSRHHEAPANRPETCVEAVLEKTAMRLARHDEDRRKAIVSATREQAFAQIETTEEQAFSFDLDAGAYRPRPEMRLTIPVKYLAEPDDWIASPNGKAFLAKIAEDKYFSQYSDSNRSPYSLKQGNEMAEAILSVKDPGDRIEKLENAFEYGQSVQDYLHYDPASEFDSLLEAIEEEIEAWDNDAMRDAFDRDEWKQALEQNLCDILSDKDESDVTDMLGSYDLAEVVFIFHPRAKYPLDCMISSNRPWADWSDLVMDGSLQHALSSVGYTLTEYRQHSKNKNETCELLHGLKKRKPALVSLDKLQSLVENACSSNFYFCLYAQVPITDLIELDTDQPITFSNAALATYNPHSGTFFDTILNAPVTVKPSEGKLYSCDKWYGPDDICGLVSRPYQGKLSNPKEDQAQAA